MDRPSLLKRLLEAEYGLTKEWFLIMDLTRIRVSSLGTDLERARRTVRSALLEAHKRMMRKQVKSKRRTKPRMEKAEWFVERKLDLLILAVALDRKRCALKKE